MVSSQSHKQHPNSEKCKKNNRIIYDSENGEKFTVIYKRLEGHDTIFTANKDRLCYNNMSNTKDVSMLSTVEED